MPNYLLDLVISANFLKAFTSTTTTPFLFANQVTFAYDQSPTNVIWCSFSAFVKIHFICMILTFGSLSCCHQFRTIVYCTTINLFFLVSSTFMSNLKHLFFLAIAFCFLPHHSSTKFSSVTLQLRGCQIVSHKFADKLLQFAFSSTYFSCRPAIAAVFI